MAFKNKLKSEAAIRKVESHECSQKFAFAAAEEKLIFFLHQM